MRQSNGQYATGWSQATGGTTTYQRMAMSVAIPAPTFGISIDFDVDVDLTKTSANPIVTVNNNYYSLENAVYGVYSDAKCTDEIATITTDKNGKGASGTITLASGTTAIYVKEKKAPAGYEMDPTVHTVTITNEVAQPLSVTDVPLTGSASISKINSSGAGIAGAQFQMTNWKGEVVKTWTSTTSPTLTISSGCLTNLSAIWLL